MTSASPDSPKLGPVQSQERVILLDVLRAFAILGMFYANFRPGGFASHVVAVINYGSGFQSLMAGAVDVLVAAKFRALFGLVMGVGMAVQFGRAEERGVDVFPVYLRRLLFLFLLGSVMGVFVSVSYLRKLAVAGLVALFVVYPTRQRTRLLLLIIVWIFVGQTAEDTTYAFERTASFALTPEQVEARIAGHKEVRLRQLAEASTVQSPVHPARIISGEFRQNLGRVPVELRTMDSLLLWATELLPFMLLGSLLWQMGVLKRPSEHRRFFTYLLVFGGGVGLATGWIGADLTHGLSLARYHLGEPLTPTADAFRVFCLNLAVPGLVLAYTSLVALLVTAQWSGRFFTKLAPAGRMAFTNYIIHGMLPPVLFPLLFGWWLPEPGPAQAILKVTVAFILLVLFSTWWLKRFRFGPFEWLWRSLTYWKLQPMRVERPVPAE